MRCSFCAETIDPNAAWKGSGERFYCSEFCADSETIIPVRHELPQDGPRKEQIDRQYVERLARLIPLRQSMHSPAR